MGLTDGAKSPPGTIRGDFGISVQNNLVHGSDSPENATAEIALWFKSEELVAIPRQMPPGWAEVTCEVSGF